MSELGVGDELLGAADADTPRVTASAIAAEVGGNEKSEGQEQIPRVDDADEVSKKPRSEEDLQAIEAMPIVILKGFESKGGSARREELLDTMAQWAAGLAENQVSSLLPSLYTYSLCIRLHTSSL